MQVLTAVVILAGAFFHVYTVMTDLPIEVIKSAQRLHMGWWLFYVFFLPCTILHTGIGIYRIAVKYGFLSKEKRYFLARGHLVGNGLLSGSGNLRPDSRMVYR